MKIEEVEVTAKKKNVRIFVEDFPDASSGNKTTMEAFISNQGSLTSKTNDAYYSKLGRINYEGWVDFPYKRKKHPDANDQADDNDDDDDDNDDEVKVDDTEERKLIKIARDAIIPSRRQLSDIMPSDYGYRNLSEIKGGAQTLSIAYPVAEARRIRYRIFCVGNGSFIDTFEEPAASEFSPARINSDWRPQFKRYLATFNINTGNTTFDDALLRSLFDPMRYGRKVSNTCENLLLAAGDAFVKAAREGWFPEVDFVSNADYERDREVALSREEVMEEISFKSDKVLPKIDSWVYNVPRRKNVRNELAASITKITSNSSRMGTTNTRNNILALIGPLMPRVTFALLRTSNGGLFGTSNDAHKRMIKAYCSSDIPFDCDSMRAKSMAKTRQYVGFICPDTGHFNYVDNIYSAFLITSIIETTIILNWRPVIHQSDKTTRDREINRELMVIKRIRENGQGMPGYIQTLYNKARSLEYIWNMKRHEISEWKSPYYYERGFQ